MLCRNRKTHVPVARIEQLQSRRYLAGLSIPALSSLPGAGAYLYLDFDGDVARRWQGRDVAPELPWDLDGNAASFNPLETAEIRETFSRVADIFSPFNI